MRGFIRGRGLRKGLGAVPSLTRSRLQYSAGQRSENEQDPILYTWGDVWVGAGWPGRKHGCWADEPTTMAMAIAIAMAMVVVSWLAWRASWVPAIVVAAVGVVGGEQTSPTYTYGPCLLFSTAALRFFSFAACELAQGRCILATSPFMATREG